MCAVPHRARMGLWGDNGGMLETLAMILCAVWVAGLVSGNALGGLIHIFLVGGMVSLYLHHRAESRAKAAALAAGESHLSPAMKKPVKRTPATGKTRKPGSRPSAAA